MTILNAGSGALAAGPAGKSAYQVALDNGFVGSQAQWIASLMGPAGTAGAPGLNGASGPSGTSAPNSVLNTMLAQMPTLTVKANVTGATANAADSTLSAVIDACLGNTRGSILYRGAGGWNIAAPGTAGYTLTSNGAGADPTYQASANAVYCPVRQTVTSGPQSAGAPTFLPATSASLTLTAQNVSTGVNALTLGGAAGYGANGALNYVQALTANPVWSGLTASTTCYLYINAQTGAAGFSTLQPIYQFGGTISTVSGQFTFDYEAMIGYLGNGTTAPATPIVFVGECVTAAGSVTSTIAYAFNGRATITQSVLALSTQYALNHNIGTSVLMLRQCLICKTAELGWLVGERVYDYFYQASASSMYYTAFGVSRTVVYISTGNAGVGAVGKGSFNIGSFTTANWAASAEIVRGF